MKRKGTGVPIYFTLIAENNSGQRSEVFCYLPTYDVTLPGGRFQEEFLSTSNPNVLKAYVTVYEDSELQLVQVGVGYGKHIYGDQIVPWKLINLDHNSVSDNFGNIIFLLNFRHLTVIPLILISWKWNFTPSIVQIVYPGITGFRQSNTQILISQ